MADRRRGRDGTRGESVGEAVAVTAGDVGSDIEGSGGEVGGEGSGGEVGGEGGGGEGVGEGGGGEGGGEGGGGEGGGEGVRDG